MNFSFSFFPSSYIGLRLLGFLVFPISFFEKIFDLVFCLDRFSIVVVVSVWIVFVFSFWSS